MQSPDSSHKVKFQQHHLFYVHDFRIHDLHGMDVSGCWYHDFLIAQIYKNISLESKANAQLSTKSENNTKRQKCEQDEEIHFNLLSQFLSSFTLFAQAQSVMKTVFFALANQAEKRVR